MFFKALVNYWSIIGAMKFGFSLAYIVRSFVKGVGNIAGYIVRVKPTEFRYPIDCRNEQFWASIRRWRTLTQPAK